jgi:hypothetical protein
LFIGLIVLSKSGFTCHCEPFQPDFYKNISSHTLNCIAVCDTTNYDFVYNDLLSQTAYFRIIDTLNLSGYDIGDTILVTGQDGLNCGADVISFNKGDTMVLALYQGFYYDFERDTFYLEGACGKFYLEIKNGQNSGISLEEIKRRIESIINSFEYITELEQVEVFPIPAENTILIQSRKVPIISINVIDQLGRINFIGCDINDYICHLDISELPSGLYYIQIKTTVGYEGKCFIKN